MTESSYPPSSHAPKSGTRGRIKRGSKRLKTPPNSHIVERAVRIGESQQTRRSGKRASAAREPTPAPPPPEGGGEKERARTRQTNAQRHYRPSRRTKVEREGRKHPIKTLGAPQTPPLFPCPPKGREEEEEEDPGSETPKEVSAKREVEGAEGTEPEGREDVLHKKNTSTVPPEPKTQSTRHNIALAQNNPYT